MKAKSKYLKNLLLNNISKPDYVKKAKRLARGPGENGCKSGRGSDGQKARSGSANPHTEGGQFRSYLRQRKVGFTRRRTPVAIVKTSQLDAVSTKVGTSNITLASLISELKLDARKVVKLLFDKAPSNKLTVEVHLASKTAKDAVSVNLVKTT